MFAAFMVGLGLGSAACPVDQDVQTKQPCIYVNVAAKHAEVNALAAAAMISRFRRENGLGPVTVDPELTRVAQAHSRTMAALNMMGHDVGTSFHERRRAIRARVVVENIDAGFYSLAETFSRWQNSPGHRANMLDPDMTRLGIAAIRTSDPFNKVFWTLVMASPRR